MAQLNLEQVIDSLIESKALRKSERKTESNREQSYILKVNKGEHSEEGFYITETELTTLVNDVITLGRANLNKSFQHEYNESDGSCDIYYMQYHRDVLVLSEYKISLEIKDNKPILMVDSKVTESPGEWY
jgi:hypothetical protein